MEKIYTPRQIADMLHLNLKYVQRLCREGKIPSFRIENRYRIRESDLEAFIKSLPRTEQTTEETTN